MILVSLILDLQSIWMLAIFDRNSEENSKKPIAVGPWGGQSGSNWDDGVYTTVRRILITHGAGIDSILFEYDENGKSVWSNKHGGSGGYKTDEVKLAYPNEFLTSVHGYYGPLYHGGSVCVRSLTFISNEKTHGPFGVELGTFFSYPKPGHKIVGFFGRSGWFVDAIGAYLKPVEQKNMSSAIAYSQSFVPNGVENSGYSVIQGSLGKDYDIVLAIKQRENFYNAPAPPKIREMDTTASPKTFSRQSSYSDYSDMEGKDKVLAFPLAENKPPGIVTLGPWGGYGGTVFDDGIHSGIRQIIISRNVGIVYLKMLYELKGEAVWGKRTGGTGGYKKDKIVFDYPYEILTHITGYYAPTMISSNIIKSLTFHTTMRKYGPFGEEQGTSFTSKSKEGTIVGFHGRKGLFLDAIGVHVKEGEVTPPVRPPLHLNDIGQPVIKPAFEGNPLWPSKQIVARGTPVEEPNHKIVKEPAPCGPGPWGGDGGKPWDDGVFTGIKQVFLTRSEAICSIQVEYDRNGQSVWSVKHGGSTGTATHRIKLEYPHEMLTCISGYYGPATKDDHCRVIRSLTFYTSRGKYGPFGEEIGTYFTSTTTEGKVVGFHGRSGSYLDAIGIHMQHWLGNSKQAKPSYFKMFS